MTLLATAGDLVLFQSEAEVSSERWRSSTEHLSRLQLARAMEALGAATRYLGLDGLALEPRAESPTDSVKKILGTRLQGM